MAVYAIIGGMITVLLGIVIWLAREVGKTSAIADEAESDLHEAAKLMKESTDANQTREQISRDYTSGEPRRMRGKYDID